MKKEGFRKYFAILLVLLFLAFLLFTVYTFANGFFGGLLLYIVLLPVYNYLLMRKIPPKISSIIVVFVALFLIIFPLIFILGLVGGEVLSLFQNRQEIFDAGKDFFILVSEKVPFLSEDFFANQLNSFGTFLSSLFFEFISNAGGFVVNLLIALFVLYFLLIQKSLFKKVEKIIPFNKKNSKKLIQSLKDVSYSTVVVSGILALLQGSLLGLAFFIFGVKGIFLWAFITAILSFLPVVGPSLVWIPATVIQLVQKDYFAGIGILVSGIILSNADNLIRPYLGEKIARIHPLITLVGIFVGILLFGIIGIFVGPLLISFAILILKMFKEEYYLKKFK